MSARKTTLDELYTTLLALVVKVTGRPTWRKNGIQVQPRGPYATVLLREGPSPTQDVVYDDSDTGGQFPTGLTLLECKVEFFRNVAIMSANEAAIRFRQSLQMEARFWDLWTISGLCGEIRFIDVSSMFRGDIEGRAEIQFNLYADIGTVPLVTEPIADIGSLEIDVYRTTDDPPAIATINIPQEV